MYNYVFYDVLAGDSCAVTDPSQAQDDRVVGMYGDVVWNATISTFHSSGVR